MPELKISSIIIAKNEEANIGRCIDSQKACIDEIVLVADDSGSDRTLEIAESKGVKCFHQKWMGYSKTKEFALSHTSNEWVLWIDADEALTPELANEIKEFKTKIPAHAAYSMPRKANFLGRGIMHGGWYPSRVTRLFNKTKAGFSDSDVHETLIVNGTTGELMHDMEHYTDPSIKHYYSKFNKYTTLAAEELERRGKKFRITDILLRPLFLFIKMYILRGGFLDGMQGLMLAIFSANYVFTKYCKLWEKKITAK
ncbi:MAG TPA: glycosyltransferase family 2 protein [Ignavibacteriales bacterium]|nr:glycosyltransferase family 2 protein [Ignavibacteriales bacterium]